MDDATRDLLAYYGIAEDTPAVEAEGAKPPSGRTKEERADMNDVHFEAQLYVDGLLQKHGIRELKEHSKRITGHIRSLDSEMQMLVYQNYNKFISATDMIRQMKTNVEAMEVEMGNLVKSMDQISVCSSKIETKLAPNRGSLDNLVGVSKLLKRLKFLFELPAKLDKSIELGAYAQAVRYFRISNKILKQYDHINSFKKIRIESTHSINRLKITLGELVKNPETTAEKQMESAGLLMELDSPPEHLLHDIFDGRKAKMIADIKRCVQDTAAITTPMYEMVVHNTEEPSAGPELIALLERNFFPAFKLFASAFTDTFIRSKTGPAVKVCEEGLCDFTKEVFTECSNAVRDYLEKLASVAAVGPVRPRRNSTSPEDGKEERKSESNSNPDLQAVIKLTGSMATFHEIMLSCDRLVPKAHLMERVAEVLEIALRSCVESIAESTQRHIATTLKSVHSDLVANRTKHLAPSVKISAVAIREAIEAGIVLLVPLLAMNAYEATAVVGKTLRMASKDMAPGFLSRMIQYLITATSKDPDMKEDSVVAQPAHSIYWLYLSHTMGSIESTQLPKAHRFLVTQFPEQPSEVDPEFGIVLKTAVVNLRVSYVEAHAAVCSGIIRAGLARGESDISKNESPILKLLVAHLRTLCTELGVMFPTLPQLKIESQLTIHVAGAQDDKTRLLRERVQVLGTVQDNPLSLSAAIFRLLVKSFIEHVRLIPRLTQVMCSQIQAEVHVLRALLSGMLSSGGGTPATKDVDSLLDELLSAASDRCVAERSLLSADELQSRKTALMQYAGI